MWIDSAHKKLHLVTSTFIIVLLTIMSACSVGGCMENRNSVPLAGFYDSQDQNITLDSLEVSGLGMPENHPLSAAGNRIKSIYLPMRSTQESTTWLFAYKWKDLDFPQLIDTISFSYTSLPFFASSDCGVIYKYDIHTVSHTSHLIDSIVLSDSLITNVDIEQIRIYFRTANVDEEGGEDAQ